MLLDGILVWFELNSSSYMAEWFAKKVYYGPAFETLSGSSPHGGLRFLTLLGSASLTA